MSSWFCETCGRSMDHQGVARHRAMHRDRHERVVMRHAIRGLRIETLTYDYRELESDDSGRN